MRPFPQFIQLYPTDRCNQDCAFCFNGNARPKEDLSASNACRLIDIMLEQGIHDLDIMGGEPFLLGWMPSYLRAAINKGITINISTNGSFPGVMEELRGTNPERINIGVSLEGSNAEKHCRLTRSNHYGQAITTISTLVSLGLNPIVKTVVSRKTADDIPNIINLLKGLGVWRYYLIHMDLLSTDPSDKEDVLSFVGFMDFYHDIRAQNHGIEIKRVNASCFERHTLPDGVRCAGGVRKLAVMPDGSVYPCNLFQHFPEFDLGNIFTKGLTDIWNSPKLDFFRSFERNRCGMTACPKIASCTGGCPAHGYFHGLDMNGSDIRCAEP